MQTLFARLIGLMPYLPEELALAAANVDEPSALCHLVASTLRLKTEEKQQLLELADVEKRLRTVLVILNRELEVAELGSKIQSQVMSRDGVVAARVLPARAAEGDPGGARARATRSRPSSTELREPRHRGRRSRGRRARRSTASSPGSSKLPTASAEYGVIRTYVEWILSLPWDKATEDKLDLVQARKILDADHYDLDKVKERIVEYLAVSKLKAGDLAGPILCFVGPPGVGKTSLGQSIARTLGPQVRAHLGRRRARRGRDPRSPAHVHRRDARDDHPGAPRRRRRRTRSS